MPRSKSVIGRRRRRRSAAGQEPVRQPALHRRAAGRAARYDPTDPEIHAYETDFRQRVRAGDGFEFFFDVKEDEKGIEGRSASSCHLRHRQRRDAQVLPLPQAGWRRGLLRREGNTSRKFLMRRPVRGEDVRITSGFGMRRHPMLQVAARCTTAWTGPPPPARRSWRQATASSKKRAQGRIRQLHPHPARQRLQDGLRAHVALCHRREPRREGAAGPDHRLRRLHRPVLGTARALRGAGQRGHVDPMSIQVPRDRQLTGKQLADFQKEKARIDELMRRNPSSPGSRCRRRM